MLQFLSIELCGAIHIDSGDCSLSLSRCAASLRPSPPSSQRAATPTRAASPTEEALVLFFFGLYNNTLLLCLWAHSRRKKGGQRRGGERQRVRVRAHFAERKSDEDHAFNLHHSLFTFSHVGDLSVCTQTIFHQPTAGPHFNFSALEKSREVRQITPSVFSQEFIYRGCARALVFHSVWINTKRTAPTPTYCTNE